MQTAHGTVTKLEALGIEPPEGLTTAVAVRRALSAAAVDSPTAPIADDLLHGRLTPDEAVKRVLAAAHELTIRDKAREVVKDLDRTVERAATRAVLAAADDILTAMRPKLTAACKQLTAAVEVLGPNPDKHAIRQLGPGAIRSWDQWQAAAATLDAIRRTRLALAEAGYGSRDTRTEHLSWYLAELPDEDYLAAATSIALPGPNLARLAAHGYKLALNTPEQAAKLLAEARNATARAQAAARADNPEHAAHNKRALRNLEAWQKVGTR